uniref:Uncharacterized protein n=1 Tax=Clastoptera arizonana TaxID=38151 RepID=A0A1B6BZI6_9HEMI
MWKNYLKLVLFTTCSVLSIFLAPLSIAVAVVCCALALLLVPEDNFLWRYLCDNINLLYYYLVNFVLFFTNMYQKNNNSNALMRKYLNRKSENSLGLYGEKRPNPNPNLMSYSFKNESALSKSFQSPQLKSLRYNIDPSLTETTVKDRNLSMRQYASNSIKNDSLRSHNSYQDTFYNHQNNSEHSSNSTNNFQTHQEGPLTPSTRYNLNLNQKLYADVSSPGFCSRVAEKLDEPMTHQTKYCTVGVFPIVSLNNNKSLKPYLSHHNSRTVMKSPVRIRIAPPNLSLSNLDSSDQRYTSFGSDETMKSVLQVLKEISRKRIHSQESGDDDDNTKRIRTADFISADDPITQGKRPREDSPHNEEVKRQRRQFRNNEILSSLSSSIKIQPPHLEYPKKRKAQIESETNHLASTKEKLFKIQTTPSPSSTPPSTHVQQEEIICNKLEQQEEKEMQIETPCDTPTSITYYKWKTNTRMSVENVEKDSVGKKKNDDLPRLFGRFSNYKEDNDQQNGKSFKNKFDPSIALSDIYSPTNEGINHRLKEFFSPVNGDLADKIPTFMREVQKHDDKLNNLNNTEFSEPISNPNLQVTPPLLATISSPKEKPSKSVSFSHPIATTKLISDIDECSSVPIVSKKVEVSILKVGTPPKQCETNMTLESSKIIPVTISEQNQNCVISSFPIQSQANISTTTLNSQTTELNTSSFTTVKSSPVASDSSEKVTIPFKTNSVEPVSGFEINSTKSPNPEKPPTFSFGNTNVSTPAISASLSLFNNITPAITPAAKLSLFPPVEQKKESENTLGNHFVSKLNQNLSIPFNNENVIMKSSNVANPENKSLSAPSTNIFVSTNNTVNTKANFVFGSNNTASTNQNKSIFSNVFNSPSLSSDKKDSPFGNILNSKSNSGIEGSESLNKTTFTAATPTMNTQQSTPSFSLTTGNNTQSKSLGGFDASKSETKFNSFGNTNPTPNGFSFNPSNINTTKANTFGNMFSNTTPQSVSSTSFGGFGTQQTQTSTTTTPFSFGTSVQSNKSNSVFGSVSNPETTSAAPVFNFGANSTSNPLQSTFGVSVNNTTQNNPIFGSGSTSHANLSFGGTTPISTQTSIFGTNSSPKTTSSSSTTSSNKGPSGGFLSQPNSNNNNVFSSNLTNGTAPNNSSFGTSTSTSFAFGSNSSTPSAVFSFGNTNSTAPNNASVSFGSSSKPTVFNNSISSTNSNVFNFGQSTGTTSLSTQPSFQFSGGSSQPSSGGFSFNPAAATNQQNSFQINSPTPSTPPMFTLGSGAPRPKSISRARRQK